MRRRSILYALLSQALSSLVATPIHYYGPQGGPINAALVSPDDVTFQILAIKKEATAWFFHIQAHNHASHAVAILDVTTNQLLCFGSSGHSRHSLYVAATHNSIAGGRALRSPQLAKSSVSHS
ncbi:MAG: hypothetical protein ACLQUY_09645 [Ktedonobacterales bacterium]